MRAIPEIGLLPEVFDTKRFERREAQEFALEALLPQLRNTFFLRILSSPQWHESATSFCELKKLFKEFIEVLYKNNRVIVENGHVEETIHDWLAAYQRSHRKRELVGLVLDDLSEDQIAEPPSRNISRLFEADWWLSERSDLSFSANGSPTLKDHFGVLMSLAERFDFVDQYLNPVAEDYAEFLTLIGYLARSPKKKPHIAFHMVECPRLWSESLWREYFDPVHRRLVNTGKSARVRIWDRSDLPDRLHDRFLLTNLVNFCFGRGFACSRNRVDTAYSISKAKGNELASLLRCDVNAEIRPKWDFAIGDPE